MTDRINIYTYQDEEDGLYYINVNDDFFIEGLTQEECEALTIKEIKERYEIARAEWED